MNMTQTAVPAIHPLEVGRPAFRRLIGTLVSIPAAGVLGLAAWLEPAEAGLGTHTQLNMPPCAWILAADIPCPTCGMTTAFAHAAEGDLVSAFVAQPMGAVLAVVTAVILVVGTYTAVTGSRLATLFERLWGRRAAWALVLGFSGAWLYKVAAYKDFLG